MSKLTITEIQMMSADGWEFSYNAFIEEIEGIQAGASFPSVVSFFEHLDDDTGNYMWSYSAIHKPDTNTKLFDDIMDALNARGFSPESEAEK